MNVLLSWMEITRGIGLVYTFIVHLLAKGWLGFVFRSNEYALSVLKYVWFMDRSYLSIKLWHPLFRDETMETPPIWVKFLGHLMDFLTPLALQAICD